MKLQKEKGQKDFYFYNGKTVQYKIEKVSFDGKISWHLESTEYENEDDSFYCIERNYTFLGSFESLEDVKKQIKKIEHK